MIFVVWVFLLPFLFIPAAVVGGGIGYFVWRGVRIIACLVLSIILSPLIDLGADYHRHMRSSNKDEIKFNIEFHRRMENTVLWQPPLFLSLLIGCGVGALVRKSSKEPK